MDFAIYEKLLQFLKELFEREERSHCSIIFHGGEPLLYKPEFYQRAIDQTKTILAGISEPSFMMQTNGSLINDTWIQFFKDFNVSVGVSFDVLEDVHNTNRPNANGHPSYQIVLSKIKKMQENGLQPSILGVMHEGLIGREQEIITFLENTDISVRLNPLFECGSAATKGLATACIEGAYGTSLIKLARQWISAEKTLNIQPLNGFLTALLSQTSTPECSFNGSCGQSVMAISPDGSLYPCGRWADIGQIGCYGNIQTVNYDQYQSHPFRAKLVARARQNTIKACSHCPDYSLCRGGCSASAYGRHHKLDAPTAQCKDYQTFFKYLKTEGIEQFKTGLLAYRKTLQEEIHTLEDST